MPLKDQRKNKTSGVPELGRIRLGTKNDKGYPQDAGEHFVCDPHEPNKPGAPRVAEAFGSRPTEIPVFLPFRDIEQNISARYALYARSGALCTGDGETIEYLWGPEGYTVTEKTVNQNPQVTQRKVIHHGRVVESYTDDTQSYQVGDRVPCPGAEATYTRCQMCKPDIKISLIVRDPHNPVPWNGVEVYAAPLNTELGIYVVSSGSLMAYNNMLDYLEFVQQMYNLKTLEGVPFILYRQEQKLQRVIKGQITTVTKHVPMLRVDMEELERMLQAGIINPTPMMVAGSGVQLQAPAEPLPLEAGEYVDSESPYDLDDADDSTHDPTHQTTPPRPWPPDYLRDYITVRIQDKVADDFLNDGAITDPEIWALCSVLDNLFDGTANEKKRLRHELTRYLVGKPSTKDMTVAEGQVLAAWAKTHEAQAEARAVLNASAQEKGQTSFLEETP